MINIEGVFCWTVSITVFYWIHANKEYKHFFQNRIDEIHKLTDGIENPAEAGSRGCLASELAHGNLWWKGPAWLKGPPKNYPNPETSNEEDLTEECTREFKAKERSPENVTHEATTVNLDATRILYTWNSSRTHPWAICSQMRETSLHNI